MMGHYDSQREDTAREDREKMRESARIEAKRLRVPILADSVFKPLGVCGHCAKPVFAIPNWDCESGACPHRPRV